MTRDVNSGCTRAFQAAIGLADVEPFPVDGKFDRQARLADKLRFVDINGKPKSGLEGIPTGCEPRGTDDPATRSPGITGLHQPVGRVCAFVQPGDGCRALSALIERWCLDPG